MTLDDVTAVAGIPLEDVVACSEQPGVHALVSVDEVVARSAEETVGAVAAEDRVIAIAAVDGDGDEGREVTRRGERVVAAVGVEHELLRRADVDAERGRVHSVEAHTCPVGGRAERLRTIASVDLRGIDAVTAFVQVGVVSRVPDHEVVARLAECLIVGVAAGERVVVGAAEELVSSAFAEERVVAGLPDEQVVPRAAGQGVVTRAADERCSWKCTVHLVERDGVVAATTDDRDRSRVCNRRRRSDDADVAVVHEDPSGCVTADHDGVVLCVTDDREDAERRDR